MRDEQSSNICPSCSWRPRNELATVQTAQRQYFNARKELRSEVRAQSSALDVAKWRTSCFAARACCTKCHRPPQRNRTLSFEVMYPYEPLQDRRSFMRDEKSRQIQLVHPEVYEMADASSRNSSRTQPPSTLPHPIPRTFRRCRKIKHDRSFHLRPYLRDFVHFLYS